MAQNIEKQFTEAFANFQDELSVLQILQSSVGCANSCEMCSQWASSWITRITRDSMVQIFSGLKRLRKNVNPWLWERRFHKPWIIFPYLDTDVGSDPNLDLIIKSLWRDFCCKTRISTVWFSRHNEWLQKMHHRIANELGQYIEGFRISITPYTENFYSEEYPQDIANLLDLYLPVIESQWVGRDIFACELRFPPFVQNSEVITWFFWDRFFIRSWNYLFIADSWNISITNNEIVGMDRWTVQFKEPMITGKIYLFDGLSDLSIEDILLRQNYTHWNLCKATNIDGEVYAVNPLFQIDGHFQAIHFFPKTNTRNKSGVIDSRRPFLNAMIDYKTWRQVSWKAKLVNGDIDDFLSFLRSYISINAWTKELRDFWGKEILPVIYVIARIIKLSRLADDMFFDPKFVVDTWHIVNQGRARHIFRWLISKSDEPLTINEMKWYAMENSIGSARGAVYRLAPIPLNSGWIRNIIRAKSGLILSWLHHKWLQPIPEKTHFVPIDIERTFFPKRDIISNFGIPWLSKHG